MRGVQSRLHPRVDRTGPPQKTAVQLAAGGGHLEVLEELARHTAQSDWLVRQDLNTPHLNYVELAGLFLLHKRSPASLPKEIRYIRR